MIGADIKVSNIKGDTMAQEDKKTQTLISFQERLLRLRLKDSKERDYFLVDENKQEREKKLEHA